MAAFLILAIAWAFMEATGKDMWHIAKTGSTPPRWEASRAKAVDRSARRTNRQSYRLNKKASRTGPTMPEIAGQYMRALASTSVENASARRQHKAGLKTERKQAAATVRHQKKLERVQSRPVAQRPNWNGITAAPTTPTYDTPEPARVLTEAPAPAPQAGTEEPEPQVQEPERPTPQVKPVRTKAVGKISYLRNGEWHDSTAADQQQMDDWVEHLRTGYLNGEVEDYRLNDAEDPQKPTRPEPEQTPEHPGGNVVPLGQRKPTGEVLSLHDAIRVVEHLQRSVAEIVASTERGSADLAAANIENASALRQHLNMGAEALDEAGQHLANAHTMLRQQLPISDAHAAANNQGGDKSFHVGSE